MASLVHGFSSRLQKTVPPVVKIWTSICRSSGPPSRSSDRRPLSARTHVLFTVVNDFPSALSTPQFSFLPLVGAGKGPCNLFGSSLGPAPASSRKNIGSRLWSASDPPQLNVSFQQAGRHLRHYWIPFCRFYQWHHPRPSPLAGVGLLSGRTVLKPGRVVQFLCSPHFLGLGHFFPCACEASLRCRSRDIPDPFPCRSNSTAIPRSSPSPLPFS